LTAAPGFCGTASASKPLTAGWNVLEGLIAVAAGTFASSIALIAFGVDSLVETSAAHRVAGGKVVPAWPPRLVVSFHPAGASA
jgi:hypothetical protein